jgi:glycine betaine/choline ABC-type transport system substrate-binding protein
LLLAEHDLDLETIFAFCSVARPQQIVVGSKKFTESYVLGEIAKTALQNAGFTVEHKQGMGGTIILWQALRGGEIALYPEYTGTITEEILKTKQPLSTDGMRAVLRQEGVGMTGELGPQYKAVFLYRLDMDSRAVAASEKLVGTLDEARMRRLNSEAERTKDYALAAALYFGQKPVSPSNSLIGKIGRWTLRHLELVGASLFLGIIVGQVLPGFDASRCELHLRAIEAKTK